MIFELSTALFFILFIRWMYEFIRRRPMLKDVKDKYILVTGCDTGFGNALVKRLDELGCHVLAACYTQNGAGNINMSCSSNVVTFMLDVSSEESVQSALVFVKDNLPAGQGLWGLVNNAGIGAYTIIPFEYQKRIDFQKLLDVNLLGLTDMTLTFLPLIREAKGRVVNMSSAAGRSSAPFNTPYPVSKYGVEAFSDSLRMYLLNTGVKVSILEPGLFATNIVSQDVIRVQAQRGYDRLTTEQKEKLGTNYVEKAVRAFMKTSEIGASQDVKPVVDAYVHALLGVHPKKRYCIGWDNYLFFQPFSYMPSCVHDVVARVVYKGIISQGKNIH